MMRKIPRSIALHQLSCPVFLQLLTNHDTVSCGPGFLNPRYGSCGQEGMEVVLWVTFKVMQSCNFLHCSTSQNASLPHQLSSSQSQTSKPFTHAEVWYLDISSHSRKINKRFFAAALKPLLRSSIPFTSSKKYGRTNKYVVNR